jgi:hypothetical protein
MRDKNLEQRMKIVKIGKSASETLALLTLANGEYAMKKSRAFELHRQFKEEREYMQDNPISWQLKPGRTDAQVARVRTCVRSDRRLGARLIAEGLNMNRETVRQIITEDLRMRTFSGKVVGAWNLDR